MSWRLHYEVDYLYTLGTDEGAGSQISLSRVSSDRAYHYDGSGSVYSPNDVIPPNQWLVSSQIVGGNTPKSHDLFITGASVMRTDSTGNYSANPSTCVVGNWTSGNYRFIGDLVELLVYDGALSESERSARLKFAERPKHSITNIDSHFHRCSFRSSVVPFLN